MSWRYTKVGARATDVVLALLLLVCGLVSLAMMSGIIWVVCKVLMYPASCLI